MAGWQGAMAGVLMALASAVATSTAAGAASIFDEVEPIVQPAPASPRALQLAPGLRIVDVAVSPLAPVAVVLAEDAGAGQRLLRWDFGTADAAATPVVLDGLPRLNSLAWHPKGGALFAAGGDDILAFDPDRLQATPRRVWTNGRPVAQLVAAPRPFGYGDRPAYRLMFAERQPDGRTGVRTVREDGKVAYLLTGLVADPPLQVEDGLRETVNVDEVPAPLALADMRPVGFHPAGHLMLLADAQGCFTRWYYNLDTWGQAGPQGGDCGGWIGYAPNGATLLRWWPGRPGVELSDSREDGRRTVLGDVTALLPPRITADGRGLVLATAGAVRYQPVDIALADVVNAWMFIETPADRRLLAAEGGVLRRFGDNPEQLYQLYDTESYYCGGPDFRAPTRPYFVTTDIFWEVYAAAYQGIFMTVERQRAMPAFRAMVGHAADGLAAQAPDSRLARAFAAARAVLDDRTAGNAEAGRIAAAAGPARSDDWQIDIDYADFAPRSHYVRDPAGRAYFRAMRYLARLPLSDADVALLRSLPAAVGQEAGQWLAAYRAFIAAARAPSAWAGGPAPAPYARRPQRDARLFPLSWGWDNEILDGTIHHDDLPMSGPKGPRLLPGGLDVAAALGSTLATALLADDGQFADYPDLEPRLRDLAARVRAERAGPHQTLYARWLDALAVQWAAADGLAGPLWQAKRLQTGLASWATLRHATVLVNDTAAAQCGEAGFEPIVMRPPRGHVEPDPAGFAAIAALFDETAATVGRLWPASDAMAGGIIRRLQESGDTVRRFAAMAERQGRGEALTPEDYEAILYVGRAAEHNFLVFYSLTKDENALAAPDPIMKVVDVAGSGQTGYLEAAVGMPLEWDQIMPSFGRREIAKGAVYSYHEFTSARPIDDAAWVRMAPAAAHPAWIARFMSDRRLACPPEAP